MKKRLAIIGCGRLGRALGRLWTVRQIFIVNQVLNRSLQHARDAAAFIGAGIPVDRIEDVQPADVYLIATPDDHIAETCSVLAGQGLLADSGIVFHCSGSLSSGILHRASAAGAAVASIHPIRSFADPVAVAEHFSGTWCGVEGDAAALELLLPAFHAIGARTVAVDPDKKTLYHAAAVFACNYLVTLLDVARQNAVAAGIEPDHALPLLQQLVRETVDNVFKHGPEAALTGPIARGDIATAERQWQAVAQANPAHGTLYRELMQATMALAARRS